jgi:tetratricopeptide (TPR) repeat protein
MLSHPLVVSDIDRKETNMNNTCPKCNAELRTDAKFCDKCGAPVSVEEVSAPEAAAPATPAKVNWTALIVIIVVLAVMGWLLFGQDRAANNTNVAATTANAHGTGAAESSQGGSGMDTAANPHGGMEGMDSGMGSGMPDIDGLKARLEVDPLDTEALFSLYQTYGMIGRGAQVRPYLEAAVAEVEAKQNELGDKLEDTINNLSMAALVFGSDLEGARIASEKAIELVPDSIPPLKVLGDVYYWQDMHQEAIMWYSRYFAVATPENREGEYWYAMANACEMYLLASEENGDVELISQAVDDLTTVTEQLPQHFAARFNLAKGMLMLGDEAEAERIWEEARALATSEHDTWKVDAALAEMRGEELPPEPNPMAGMGGSAAPGGMGGMANPHGDMGSSGDGAAVPNPHGA